MSEINDSESSRLIQNSYKRIMKYVYAFGMEL